MRAQIKYIENKYTDKGQVYSAGTVEEDMPEQVNWWRKFAICLLNSVTAFKSSEEKPKSRRSILNGNSDDDGDKNEERINLVPQKQLEFEPLDDTACVLANATVRGFSFAEKIWFDFFVDKLARSGKHQRQAGQSRPEEVNSTPKKFEADLDLRKDIFKGVNGRQVVNGTEVLTITKQTNVNA
ncbi:hypothetical protein EJ03DRAFT_349777 [Teratosphaeria nubilosa]|uniref:Uncharacterized protein n=1 Tax=Teratosphaeria nubilosa TaxID=161662 RepID=A0A6G1LER4_9PEZI|nr:hypothetical protein EJ03DRAFT_349777 [Teratosphaeria nubilosa]